MNNEGKILQITGAVVDVKFDEDHLPKIMNALSIKRDDGTDLVLETAQHLRPCLIRPLRSMPMCLDGGLKPTPRP